VQPTALAVVLLSALTIALPAFEGDIAFKIVPQE